jgi:hypothetical protein
MKIYTYKELQKLEIGTVLIPTKWINEKPDFRIVLSGNGLLYVRESGFVAICGANWQSETFVIADETVEFTVRLKKKEKVLPMTPSVLIKEMVRVYQRCMKDTQHYVYSCQYYHYFDGTRCHLGFVGAALVYLGAKPDRTAYMTDFGSENQTRIEALYDFRYGRIEQGLKRLGLELPRKLAAERDMPVVDFSPNFDSAIAQLILDFEKNGL